MSDKPMTALLRKSGIVDKHIKEFEKWKLIDPKEEHDVSAHYMMENLLEDIEKALGEEPTMKQTLVAPVFTKAPPRLWSVLSVNERGVDFEFYAVKDEMGRLVVDGRAKVYRGDTIWNEDDVHQHYAVLEVEDLYENDKVIARMITIEKEEANNAVV